ncbi:PDZ domain-containing protein 4-like [Camarhynchus parvulus]|uniref:PDZ domain-containing protein 4-like n=1 Tax=Geospiza parvula TaxID=87175 RepID=UPI00123830B6|nr:PDZ domain-containing protein 4-like [Camarhynchus parvulus]
MGCNMCVVQKPEEQHRVMLQVSGKEGPRRGGPRGGSKEPLVLQVLRRSPRGPAGAHPPPPPPPGLVDSGTQTDISFESRLGGAEPPPLPQDYFDPADLGEPERPEELEYEEVELYKTSHKLGITVCYRTDGEEDPGIYVGEVNPNSIAAKDGRIREGDRIVQINGMEIQDREEAVAFLTREQQTNISLLLARPESQRWKDSDREDFLDEFGSDEEGELRGPPSPATPGGGRGAEPDSGVGRTDESTRNEESSEHDLLGEEGGEGPPAPPRPPPPRREPQNPQNSPQNPPRLHAKAGAGLAAARSGSGSGCGSAGRGGSGAGGRRGTAGFEPGLEPGLGAGLRGEERGLGARLEPGLGAGLAPGSPPLAALSPAELRRYRALRGRCAGPAGRAELARLEEELRHLEFKCRHLLRAQQLERLRERGRRAWRDPRPGVEGPLADIAEAPERDSTSAYNTGESSRSSPLLLRAGLGAAAPPPSGAAAGTAKGPRGKRPGRDRLLKARAIKILEERGGSTDDDARSELKTGRYWSREQRKQHLARAREQRRRRELLLQGRPEPPAGPAGVAGTVGGVAEVPPPPQHGQGSRRGLRKRSRRILDNWVTIQEMMLAQHGGRLEHPLLSVTTV